MVGIAFKYGAKKADEAFMCFNVTWSDEKGPQRVMGFAWPSAVKAMYNKELDVHFDGTFKMTPKGFHQVCILGIRDHSSGGKHLPVFYILMTTKTQRAYETAFFHIKQVVGKNFILRKYFLRAIFLSNYIFWTGRELSIKSVIHDFEDAIINAVEISFNAKYHSCCWFHFKQALRRYMQELKMDTDFMHRFLELFDFLTVVDRSLIVEGVEWIRLKAKKLKDFKENKSLVTQFIDDYFLKQWNRPRMIEKWNYNGREDWKTEM